MLVKIKILGEHWKVFTQSALQGIPLRKRFDVGKIRSVKSCCLIFPVVLLQPVLEEGVHQTMAGGKVSYESCSVHCHIATLGTVEGNSLGEQRRDLVFEMNCEMV